ncbi:MAG: alkaline phosphatase family protein [Pseudobdellovibrionaceae bacterium]|nr:alkaline phosphatase family protein [Pseudobdellovibrionaceae bacterium]
MDRREFLRCGLSAAATAPFFSKNLWAQTSPIPGNVEKLQALEAGPLRRLAFGSCNKQTHDQSYWQWIAREQPQLWIWLGDCIYADRASLDTRRQWYDALKTNSFYKAFTDQVPIIGTWDDHDYFNGNADGRYEDKDASKLLMLDFMGVSPEDPVHARPGVFQKYTLGPAGQCTDIILLDLRYFMDRKKNEKSLLGELQWAFLEEAIRNSTADLLIIGSSLNVSSRITFFGLEGWNAFGGERQRLYDLLASTPTPTVLLSGDRHMGEIYRIVLGNGKPIYELMSSGLTHALGVKLPSKERQGETVGKRHYGCLDIDWGATGPQVQLQLRSNEQSRIYQNHLAQFSY